MKNNSRKRVWVTGAAGMLGSAVVRKLKQDPQVQVYAPSRSDLDLSDGAKVRDWCNEIRPAAVIHAAAKVGGIYANSTFPADFIRENLTTQINVIEASKQAGVKNLLFVATNCTYPSNAKQPIGEDAYLSGPLDVTIRSYGVAKIAGIEMCAAYRRQYGLNYFAVIPPNLYGPGDNYHPENSHIIAGMLRRAHECKINGRSTFEIWGDGSARREILHVDDLAEAIVLLAEKSQIEHSIYNIGSGQDLSVVEIAKAVLSAVNFKGEIAFDKTKPNGTLRKLLDSRRMNQLGWKPQVPIETGLKQAYADMLLRTSF